MPSSVNVTVVVSPAQKRSRKSSMLSDVDEEKQERNRLLLEELIEEH